MVQGVGSRSDQRSSVVALDLAYGLGGDSLSDLWSSVVASRKSEWRQIEVMLLASSVFFKYSRNLHRHW